MKKAVLALAILSISLASVSASIAQAQDAKPLLLRQPTLSRTDIAFMYGNDLWKVSRDGGDAIRLTAGPGIKRGPHFSPDGQWIAFTGEYAGKLNVYVISASGRHAAPRHLSPRPGHRHRMDPGRQKYSLRIATRKLSQRHLGALYRSRHGRFPHEASAPYRLGRLLLTRRKISRLSPHARALWQLEPLPRRHLSAHLDRESRGFQHSKNSLMKIGTISIRSGSATPFISFPTAMARTRFSLTTRNPTRKRRSSKIPACPLNPPTPVRARSCTNNSDRCISTISPLITSNHSSPYRIRTSSKSARISKKSRNTSMTPAISPTGVRAVFEAHGEILTVPAEKGDIRNITNSPGVADRSPAWSPDGKSSPIFPTSPANTRCTCARKTAWAKSAKSISAFRRPFSTAPTWSPDSKKIAYTDKRLNLWYVDLDKPTPVKVDTDYYDAQGLNPAWSPDNRWIAYTKQLPSHFRAVFVYSLDTGKSTQITDGMSDARLRSLR